MTKSKLVSSKGDFLSIAKENLEKEDNKNVLVKKSDKELIELFKDLVPTKNIISIVPEPLDTFQTLPDGKRLKKTDETIREEGKRMWRLGALVVSLGENAAKEYDIKVGDRVIVREDFQNRAYSEVKEGYTLVGVDSHSIAYIKK